MHLEMVPKTKAFIAKKTKLMTTQHRGGKKSTQVEILPLYPVFKDRIVQQVVVNDLKQLTRPPQQAI